MSRIARRSHETSDFHVIVQGINKEYIFDTKEDIEKYLYLIKKFAEEEEINIFAYCIMNNHAHFAVNTGSISQNYKLSKMMSKTNISYSSYYNEKYDRVGHVFRNRFVSEPICSKIQKLNCIAYIHNNPVKAGIVKKKEDYLYSSYNDYLNKRGIINSKIIEIIFEDMSIEYNEAIAFIHNRKPSNFFDIDKADNSDEIILEYEKKYNLKLQEILEVNKITLELALKLIKEEGYSLRKCAEKLNINREKLRRMLKNHN